MLERLTAAIAANRFGLGSRPGELDSIGAHGADWLRAQLLGAPPQITDAGLRSSTDILAEGLKLRREMREARKTRVAVMPTVHGGSGARAPGGSRAMAPGAGVATGPGSVAMVPGGGGEANDATLGLTAGNTRPPANAADTGALLKLGQLLRPIYVSEVTARLRQAVTTDRPLIERLTQFWTNHFAVSVDKNLLLGLAGSFEREAIRPHVLGNFTDLLLAAEQHPAMLLYLDNHLSVGPDSKAARNVERRHAERKVGINENLAREILELHTLGVGGGYTQTDVTTFAQVITGWSIGGGEGLFHRGEPGKFLFRPEIHEPGTKTVLGKRYPENGHEQGVAVLRDLAQHPSTARFIATKLVRHFIADEPPATAVDRLATAFTKSGGDLPTIYRALIDSPEAWQQPLTKFKTPSDYIVSSYRGLQIPADAGRSPLVPFELLGQRTYNPGSPAGWPDRSADWDGASALLKRIEWADTVGQRLGHRRDAAELAPQLLGATLTSQTRTAVARASSAAQAVTLLLASPEFMRR